MFNSAFDGIGATAGDYYPEPKRTEIDALNDRIYNTVNNGVYKAGFATTQNAYEDAVLPLFETLDWLDARLSNQRYLTGDTVTEADPHQTVAQPSIPGAGLSVANTRDAVRCPLARLPRVRWHSRARDLRQHEDGGRPCWAWQAARCQRRLQSDGQPLRL